jgi:hypothetical protein
MISSSTLFTGKLIIGKLSEFIGGCPINSDNFIGSDNFPIINFPVKRVELEIIATDSIPAPNY